MMSNEQKSITVETKGNELIITRDFHAPKELVFEVFSSCEHLKHWWGPKEWPMDECTMDFREGGKWHFCLRGPNEGDESWGLGIFHKIEKPDKIVWTDHFSDAEANISEEMPVAHNTAEFVEKEGKTTIISRTRYDRKEELDKAMEMGMVEGFTSTQDRLEEYLAELQQ